MSHDQDDLSAAADISAPTAVDFDQAFSAAAASAGIRRVWELGKSMSQADPAAFAAGRARCVPHQAVNGRSWRSLTAVPDLPPEVEPFSFVSADLLRHVAQALHLVQELRPVDATI